MLGTRKRVGSLEEDLKDVGLDAGKVLGEIDRMTGRLVEARAKPGANGPPVPGSAPAKAVENRALYEGRRMVAASGNAVTMVEQARQELRDAGLDPEANKDEAIKIVKKKRMSAAKKVAARLTRRKGRAKARKASKMYRSRNKRKILKRARAKVKKFGLKALAKLHKAGRRVMMKMDVDKDLANLRESLNSAPEREECTNSYEEAAYNASMLSMYLGEVFDVLEDRESAETMFSLSDIAADLSEDLEKVAESDLSEAQEEKLRRVLDQTVKALRIWEGLGSPTLFQAMEAV